jgi:3-phenylpropionate/trans-cinnamate dioxygenase ferredoxin subunit
MEGNEGTWREVCSADNVDLEDVIQVELDDRVIAIYRSPEDTYHATDGLCTHEDAHLADGLVLGNLIECPKHNGRFNYKTGEAKRAPVCVDLRVYEVRVRSARVLVRLPEGD